MSEGSGLLAGRREAIARRGEEGLFAREFAARGDRKERESRGLTGGERASLSGKKEGRQYRGGRSELGSTDLWDRY